MSSKSKIIISGVVIGLFVLGIFLNYVSSELFSVRYWNPIKKVYINGNLVKAEVVKDKEKIEQGLAGRKSLPDGRGMLFVMPTGDFQHFWMQGMLLSIDIIWIEENRVIGCEERILPEDKRIFTSPGKASLVLEAPAGFCEKNNVEMNDSVEMP